MNDIEQKISDRAYHSPGRARAAVARSQLPAAQKRKLTAAIQVWQDEGTAEPPVVGGLPAAVAGDGEVRDERPSHVAELVPAAPTNGRSSKAELGRALNLNAPIRAQLTPYGMHILYTARKEVLVPEDLVSRGGVWETTLAQFMIAFGQHLEGPDNAVPVERFEILLLDRRS